MRRFLLYILFAVAFISCNKEESVSGDTPVSRKDAEQVTLVYFIGTDLYYKGFYGINITDAVSAVGEGALGKYGRFYYFLPSSSSLAILYELQENEDGSTTTRVVKEYALPSGSATTFETVIDDVDNDVEWAASGTMNMIVSGHGSGWIIYDSEVSSYQTPAFQISSSGAVGATQYYTRAIGDGGSHGYLNGEDLSEVLSNYRSKLGFLLFDSCLMSSIELLYRLRDCAEYIIASPCEVMGDGFPFAEIIPEIYSGESNAEIVDGVCKLFYNYYNDGLDSQETQSACVAACKTSELEALASVMSGITKGSVTQPTSLQYYIPSSYLSTYPVYDLNDYMLNASSSEDHARFKTQLDKAFPYKYHTEKYFSAYTQYYYDINDSVYSGVTTAAPVPDFTNWTDEPWAIATTN